MGAFYLQRTCSMKMDQETHCFYVKKTMGPQSQASWPGGSYDSRLTVTKKNPSFLFAPLTVRWQDALFGGPDRRRYQVVHLICVICMHYTRTSAHLPRKIQMGVRHTCQALFQSAGTCWHSGDCTVYIWQEGGDKLISDICRHRYCHAQVFDDTLRPADVYNRRTPGSLKTTPPHTDADAIYLFIQRFTHEAPPIISPPLPP